jgi:uncharacterized sulfatase
MRVLALSLLLASMQIAEGGLSPAAAAERPNIIFFLADDLASWALGCEGNPQAHTPHIDSLFRQGVTLKNFFAATPVCSPSRASIVASRYGTELWITDWIDPRKEPSLGLDPGTITWPKLLSDSGYETCLVGKWHLGTEDRFHPSKFGYQFFCGFRGGGAPIENPALEVDGATKETTGLIGDTLTDLAVDFLRKDHGGRPFLLSVHYRSPHAPWLPVSDEDWAPYKDLDPVIPNPDYPDLDVERVKTKTCEYQASVAGLDRNVGRVLEVLEETGQAKKTVVIFTSDHGYNIGHNGIIHKGNGQWITLSTRDLGGLDPALQRPNMYDKSLRVPVAIRWPGVISEGASASETLTHLDWFPTLLAMTGVALPANQIIRGRNFLPLLEGEHPAWDNEFYGEYSQHHYTTTHLRTYRTPEWKLIRDFKNAGKDELYHLSVDPDETKNLIGDSQYRQVIEDLDMKLIAKKSEIGDKLGSE